MKKKKVNRRRAGGSKSSLEHKEEVRRRGERRWRGKSGKMMGRLWRKVTGS